MKFKPPPKRAKVDAEPPLSDKLPIAYMNDVSSRKSTNIVSPSKQRDVDMRKPMVCETQTGSVNPRIHQARDHAAAEAQKDGCMGNFRIFDSPFGNYLVPVIPSRAELGG